MLSTYSQTPNDTFEAASIVYLPQELCFRSGVMGIYDLRTVWLKSCRFSSGGGSVRAPDEQVGTA